MNKFIKYSLITILVIVFIPMVLFGGFVGSYYYGQWQEAQMPHPALLADEEPSIILPSERIFTLSHYGSALSLEYVLADQFPIGAAMVDVFSALDARSEYRLVSDEEDFYEIIYEAAFEHPVNDPIFPISLRDETDVITDDLPPVTVTWQLHFKLDEVGNLAERITVTTDILAENFAADELPEIDWMDFEEEGVHMSYLEPSEALFGGHTERETSYILTNGIIERLGSEPPLEELYFLMIKSGAWGRCETRNWGIDSQPSEWNYETSCSFYARRPDWYNCTIFRAGSCEWRQHIIYHDGSFTRLSRASRARDYLIASEMISILLGFIF